MRLWRVFPFAGGPLGAEGGPLWFPRTLQGDGRHDNPHLYGVLYLSAEAVSTVVEALAVFRGTGAFEAAMLQRNGMPLALAEIELPDEAEIVDLDDPAVLLGEDLRPSSVATLRREVTQAQAERIFRQHPEAAGIGWWSVFEASWAQRSVFDRAARSLELVATTILDGAAPAVEEARAFLGLN